MKKTVLALMLVLALLTMSACSTKEPTVEPEETPVVTEAPTAEPTEEPTAKPTAEPTEAPTAEPTQEPTEEPAAESTEEPAEESTEEPAAESTEEPAAEATEEPEAEAEVIGGADGATSVYVTDEAEETAEPSVAALSLEGEEEAQAEEASLLEDTVLATAYDGAVTVLRSDVEEEYDEMLDLYISYYAQYGYEMDEYDQDFQASVAQETVQMRLSQGIVEHFAANNGYELTPEKEEELRAQVDTAIDSMREYYESYLSYYGYEGEELKKVVDDELQASGYTPEALYENARLNDLLDFIFNMATEDVTVTDEEVRASFDAKVEQQKESYANVDTFINDYVAGTQILYTPENVRLVRSLYIAQVEGEATPGEATPSELTEATQGESELADPAELTGYAKAEAVLAAIRAGESFDDAMAAYNEDGATEEQMMRGYPVSEESTLYGDEFKAAAMALENIGDVSDVIVTDYGYYILSYVEDLTPGEADFEPLKESETEEALLNKKNDAYSAFIDEILKESGYEIGDLSSLYHVYVAEVIEPTIAYATVEAETPLTDMPDGVPVATLSAGASMDVLGHIGIDGEEYAFVAVPGTQIKGYVNTASIKDMDEETALTVDNSALVVAAELPDKLPTFTIVMNDGSLIYGELYPDVAPETVGNFVTLANEGFYNGLTFHRVVPGFVIQGGDPNGDGTGGPGYAIRGEFENNGITNDLSHTRGVLSMARSSAMDSAGSQFFIMHADNDYLDGDYAGFGMVIGGIETVDLIASVPTNSNNKPMTEQVMREVYVETYGQSYTFTKLED